ncbi:hypothetical protein GCK32_015137 [Trichostrongylus colubriformis]|uniref:Uncharacterized protein n=1 Tax=Trichostrongylus colubriformis TaxID=6319 RepID=A0AAN8ESH1_TRICO
MWYPFMSAGAEALDRFGWESNYHYDVIEEKRKNENVHYELRSSPVSAPQITVRGPRSDSDAHSIGPSSRCRSSSLPAVAPPLTAARVLATSRGELRLRRTKSETAFHPSSLLRKSLMKESGDATPRCERAVTGDSVFTSGLGSLSEDSTTVEGRRGTTLDSMIVEWESRSRVSTIVYCLSQGFVANRSHLVVQGTMADMVRDPHRANTTRERWKLTPFKTKRFLEVNRNFGDPARYVYMTPEEELSLSRYRREMLADPWLFDELRRFKTDAPCIPQRVQISHIIAFPSDIEVMCLVSSFLCEFDFCNFLFLFTKNSIRKKFCSESLIYGHSCLQCKGEGYII